MRVLHITDVIELPDDGFIVTYEPIVLSLPTAEEDRAIDPEEPNASDPEPLSYPLEPIAVIKHHGSRTHSNGMGYVT